MRQGNNNNRQRSRGRSGRKQPGGQNTNRSLDSNGPSGRLRGTAAQLAEKYSSLARDARSNKDRVIVEGLLQYAEHYQRIVNAATESQAKVREQQEANRREAAVDGTDAEVRATEQPAAAKPTAEAEAQPEVAIPAGEGEQPKLDIPVEETPAPARRQRRAGGQRRNTRSATRTPAAKSEATKGAEAPAATEAAPEAAPETVDPAASVEPSE